ncbi:MAG: flagellar M-ring protein FliF, partial [Deltaproteobacteria bacterium]|nr:flagellar M-ring protein FliF [Deltaproteobacteria bacterium]
GGKVGYEIFDINNLSTTTFQENVKLIRATQGELERTISALDGVSGARVAITKPDKGLFAKKAVEPTASVLLILRPGAELTKKQIKGIANLVAGAVEGLKTENVKIVDVYGNLLTPDEDEVAEGLSGDATQLQYKNEIEQGYVRRIEQMLAKVLGPNKVVARVTADIDFSANEREEESFDPGGQVIRSERSIERGEGSAQRGGVPGVVSNLSNDANLLTAPGGDQKGSTEKESVKNYEVSRALTKVSAPRGKLLSVSVAVVVDGTYTTAPGAAPDAPKVFTPLEPQVMEQIETLVKNSVGFDPARGDSLTVQNLPFYIPEVNFVDEMKTQVTMDNIKEIMRGAFPWAFMLLVLFFLVRPLVKFLITPPEAEVDLTRLLPTGIAELEQELEVEKSRVKVPEYEPQVDLDQLNELLAENSRAVKDNPSQAALLIRYWLNDGRV